MKKIKIKCLTIIKCLLDTKKLYTYEHRVSKKA